MKLYQEELLEHYNNPKHRGIIAGADFTVEDYNPSCGDRVEFSAKISNGALGEIRFEGSGCVLSQATASMLSEYCTDKTLEEVEMLTKEEIVALVGLTLGPTRIKCVLLPLFVLQEGVRKYDRSKTIQ